MLVRLLLLLVLVILLARFLLRLGRLAAAALRDGAAAPVGPAAEEPPSVTLVPCRRCGTFVPRSSVSTAAGDGFLCRSCAAA